jgi:hypothetical protein
LRLPDELAFLDDHDATVKPLRELAREWLALVPALWSAMFRPLVRPSWGTFGRACQAWVAAIAGGLPGSLVTGNLVVHFWGMPALWMILAALLAGAVAGASVGILVFLLPSFILRIVLERWIAHDNEAISAMDETANSENKIETECER